MEPQGREEKPDRVGQEQQIHIIPLPKFLQTAPVRFGLREADGSQIRGVTSDLNAQTHHGSTGPGAAALTQLSDLRSSECIHMIWDSYA